MKSIKCVDDYIEIPKKMFLAIICGLIVLTACTKMSGVSAQTKIQKISIEHQLGIEPQAIRLAAAGYMLDFRYRTIDPDRAEVLFSRELKPYLIHEESNAHFMVPAPAKIGPLRQTTNKPVAGKTYFMMFANPGHYVKAGDKVTIVLGEHRIEHLTVE